MKGTEKQVAWAEDIRKAVVEAIDTMFEAMASANDPRANTEAAKAAQAKFRKAREAVAACENAHALIEVYGDVTRHQSQRDRMNAVAAVIRNRFRVVYNSEERALIGE